MARRRRKGRSQLGALTLIAFAAALFGAGLWLGSRRPAPPPARPAVAKAPAAPSAAPRARAAAPAPRPEAAPTEVLPPRTPAPEARIAIVIDDLGRSLDEVERLLALRARLTYAVLPFEPATAAVAARLREAGAEVIVHLPMEAEGGENPGPGAVSEDLSRRGVVARTERAIGEIAGAVGVNNHMGSLITTDEKAMNAVLGVVAARKLFFLDSRTTAETQAFEWARAQGIPAARRDVFLDDDPAREAVEAQFARLLEVARERGAAVAIGHPHDSTIAVLAERLPSARAAGFELVPVSYLLERSETLPE